MALRRLASGMYFAADVEDFISDRTSLINLNNINFGCPDISINLIYTFNSNAYHYEEGIYLELRNFIFQAQYY